MFGYVEWTESGKGVAEKTVLGLRFCRVGILRRRRTPEFLLRRRAAAAAGKLSRLGITRAVFPQRFPYEGEFARNGIRPVRTLGLCRRLTAQLVRAALQTGEGQTDGLVAVSTDRLTPEVRRIVTELCMQNRYVGLDTPDDAAPFCHQLRREYGVSLVLSRDAEQLAQAAVAVLLAPRAGLEKTRGAMLRLYEGEPFPVGRTLQLSPEQEAALPEGCSRLELLAALFEAGTLRPGQLTVCAVAPAEG